MDSSLTTQPVFVPDSSLLTETKETRNLSWLNDDCLAENDTTYKEKDGQDIVTEASEDAASSSTFLVPGSSTATGKRMRASHTEKNEKLKRKSQVSSTSASSTQHDLGNADTRSSTPTTSSSAVEEQVHDEQEEAVTSASSKQKKDHHHRQRHHGHGHGHGHGGHHHRGHGHKHKRVHSGDAVEVVSDEKHTSQMSSGTKPISQPSNSSPCSVVASTTSTISASKSKSTEKAEKNSDSDSDDTDSLIGLLTRPTKRSSKKGKGRGKEEVEDDDDDDDDEDEEDEDEEEEEEEEEEEPDTEDEKFIAPDDEDLSEHEDADADVDVDAALENNLDSKLAVKLTRAEKLALARREAEDVVKEAAIMTQSLQTEVKNGRSLRVRAAIKAPINFYETIKNDYLRLNADSHVAEWRTQLIEWQDAGAYTPPAGRVLQRTLNAKEVTAEYARGCAERGKSRQERTKAAQLAVLRAWASEGWATSLALGVLGETKGTFCTPTEIKREYLMACKARDLNPFTFEPNSASDLDAESDKSSASDSDPDAESESESESEPESVFTETDSE